MNDPNSFGYQENTGAGLAPDAGLGRPPGGNSNSMGQYKFSPEETRVLQECNKESFFQRSLPFSSIFGLGTFAAVQGGYLKPNPRFGAYPKVSLAVMLGYFVGKLSYQQACAEKLMSLPGSYIGQLLRDRRDGKIEGTALSAQPAGSMLGAAPGDIYSDAGPGSALNLDIDRPTFSDDSYRPDHDSPVSGASEPATALPPRSYDDLRRQNRGDFATNKQDPYRPLPAGSMLGATPDDIYSDAGPGSALCFENDPPTFSEASYRPDHDSSVIGAPEPPPRAYDDLRRATRAVPPTN